MNLCKMWIFFFVPWLDILIHLYFNLVKAKCNDQCQTTFAKSMPFSVIFALETAMKCLKNHLLSGSFLYQRLTYI